MGEETHWVDWLRRIIAGDASAEDELVRRYKDGIAIIIQRIVHDRSVAEDLSQETFRIALEKIRYGGVREPERLSGFICGVARNLAIDSIRKTRRLTSQEEIGKAEQLSDSQPDQLERLWRKELAEIVRQAISELKVERDREVIFRYYIAEEEKEQICADLGLSSQQFNSIMFRALKRFKELYLKRFGHF
ncbi:MAG TPA: sigma-70 family RNA polymerase sigma factor [Blastocatellia bacterium]|nr:sigma-70 family RNA polymerase sigma factor [Blastocatellia bacterium]